MATEIGCYLMIGVISFVPPGNPAREEVRFEGEPVRHWVEQLRGGSAQERVQASHALSDLGADARPAVRVLIDALEDSNRSVRRNAAEALGHIGPASKNAVPALIQRLDDEDVYVRRAASEALGEIGPVAIRALVSAMKGANEEVVFRAAGALGRIGTAAVPALAKALSAEQASVREGAARALVYMQRPITGVVPVGAVSPLIAAMESDDSDVRLWTARALGKIGPRGRAAVDPLIRGLNDENDQVRYEVVLALARIGPPAVPALIESLEHDSARVRAGAAHALSYSHPAATDAIDPLTAALRDEDQSVRFHAAEALAGIGGEAVPHLIALLESEAPLVRSGAAYALGEWYHRYNFATGNVFEASQRGTLIGPSTTALIGTLGDERVTVRRSAVYALGAITKDAHPFHAQEAVTALKRAMEDMDPTVRYQAAKALADIQPDAAPQYESKAEEIARASEIVPYPGFERDLKMLRRTSEGGDGPRAEGSSPEAIGAASRVFDNTPWLGMTRKQVLQILGDPATISDRGEQIGTEPDSPLIYTFATGRGGRQYTITFEDGRVVEVQAVGFS